MTSSTDQQFHLDLPARRTDDGLFGPESVSWRVWSHPAVVPGVMRSFVLDMVCSTHGAAALEEHSRYREDPLGRLNRTLYYFLTAVFADTATVAAANRRLDRLHARIEGSEPMTGQSYSALDPYLRLGNHMLSWHSVFYAYQTLSAGLGEKEQDQFFAEAAIAFETFGIDYDDIRASAVRHGIAEHLMPEHIPCTRDEYRQLWAASRHLICVNAQTRGALDAILHPRALDGDPVKAALFRAYPILARAGLALVPRHIRHIGGLPASTAGDAIAIAGGRAVTTLLDRSGTYPLLLKRLCPHGQDIQSQALLGFAI
ncbi:oxygenase MpaB family protein [Mycolicibacterium septicum]|uniref:Oxygenase MpaB family protein n=1 Tax=Mycolicibacterium septicum TaxID=98668 RepID=A0ABW9LZB6_9MYCO